MGTIGSVFPRLTASSLALLVIHAAGQGQPQSETRLLSRPDVMIRVQKSPVGADYVTIQMVAENYPPDLLATQCERIGSLAGSPSRGVQVSTTSSGTSPAGIPTTILTASFATTNLIDREHGILRLAPFAKAFAGNPQEHLIDCIAVSFVGEAPHPGTVGSVRNDTVVIEGATDPTNRLVDYRIHLLTQDPEKISIPDMVPAQTIQKGTPSNGSAWRLIPWIVGGGVLAGLLVYFALRPYGRRSASESKSKIPR